YGYDAIPEFLRDRYSMASRGSALVAKLPDLGYTINRRSDVWADNVAALYEEAKARRWAPAVDIPWGELDVAADPLREAAMAQARADRLLATLSMQDVARSVAYGVAHMRYHLGHQPGKAVALADYLDRSEHTVLGIAGTPEFLEPLVLLAAGSRAPAALARGAAFARRWFAG